MRKKPTTPSTFSIRLKQARSALGLTQFELGVAAGLDEYSASPRMNQYERSVHSPDFGTTVRLAEALSVPVSFLYEPDDKLAELILLAGKLSADDLEKLVQHLREAI